jgi:NADH-ubiquinone oxidoreductase chain 6
MYNIYLLNETYTNGLKVEFLDIISLLAIISGILVITSKNPIVSVLFLIGLFFSIASYLMMLGLSFIGFSYLLVYVGAVSILFLFILMLINVRISELLSNTNKSIPLAILIILSIIGVVNPLLPYNIYSFNNYILDNNTIYFVTSKLWDGNLAESSHITSIGNIMYTSYSIWLILTSIILLLAMVGAIVITIKQKESSIA